MSIFGKKSGGKNGNSAFGSILGQGVQSAFNWTTDKLGVGGSDVVNKDPNIEIQTRLDKQEQDRLNQISLTEAGQLPEDIAKRKTLASTRSLLASRQPTSILGGV